MTPDFFSASSGKLPPPRECQVRAVDDLRQGLRAGHMNQLLVLPTGGGKCLGRDTPVLMADGTTRVVQDVHAGDQLLGPDGTARNVLSVTTGREQLYRIIPKKGMIYVCNASHILSLRKTPGSDTITLSDGERIPRDADIVNVNVETFASSNKTARHCLKGWRAEAIEFPVEQEELLLDPYLLGAWLGDGNKGTFAISKPECEMVKEWKAAAQRFGYQVTETTGSTGCPTWTIVDKDPRGPRFNIYLGCLDSYGLRERKHVPHAYKVSPISARLELLAGMIDSDGHMSRAGYDWISKSKELAEDFAFLCRSVGLSAYISPCRKGIRSTGFVGDYWRVSVSGDCSIIPCRDKPAPARRQKKRHLVHGIRIEPIGEGDYYGFEIDGDHLFLLGDFTVTHNTIASLMLIAESLKKGKRATFVCDRITLINQTSANADKYGLSNHGIVQATHWRRDKNLPFQIASVQTIQARGYWPEADLVVFDEAHILHAAHKELLAAKRMPIIGLTATPCTKGLGEFFTNVVNAATMHELTEAGVLVPMRILSCTAPDMKGAETLGGEWTRKAASEREAKIIGDVVAEWAKHGENRKTIAFGADIAYCNQLVQRFNAAGIHAEAYTSETPDHECERLLEEFRKPDSIIRVLVSVEKLAKGFDVPDVGCVIDARPLRKSLSTAIQMWGRGLRSSPGKEDCILLDFTRNIVRFMEEFEDIYFNGFRTLDESEKLDAKPRKDDSDYKPTGCPSCGHQPFKRRCLACGFEKETQVLEDISSGGMKEIRLGKKKALAAENDEHLWCQVCSYARQFPGITKPAGFAYHKFIAITGRKPVWSFESAQDTPITPALRGELQRQRIAYHKARGARA